MNRLINPSQKTTSSILPNWQRNLVLIAKNTPVWLAQLSKEYQREINRLDQIPDEELEKLESLGITGLWLVGVWQRSPASKKIKHLYGHHHLIASAYSIQDYRISDSLGGDHAFNKFKIKAEKKGIYLACDMVPNHTAIDSPWLIKHPDWYMNTTVKPISSWKFETPDLSQNPEVSIHLEEGYYTQTNAAEVFRYQSKKNEQPFYIFHGNDGTSMPWNDTAQLNYLNPETRKAMRALIINVAKKFKVVRMDAAMTLIRTHYKRLWFPDAEKDVGILPRNTYYLTQAEFDALMPDEFWSEVLHDLSNEAPDTFIIAEAFWLMEKYFVQSLGMHAVYNSAFLNRLRSNENKQLREDFCDILANDPRTLGRFVNYLTTPDEIPAAEEFGKGKHYFGVCGLMAVLPGFPLFGHGQFEGLTEQYGMDFSHPFKDEPYDLEFIDEHKKLIAPLLKQRFRFSDPDNFMMFDFIDPSGKINENIHVFFNKVQTTKSLIIFNNQDKEVFGKIKSSTQLPKTKLSDLSNVLEIKNQSLITLKEIRLGNEMKIPSDLIRSNGLEFDLKPFDFFVFDIS